AQEMFLADFLDEIRRMRRRRDLARDLHQILEATDDLQLPACFQLLGEDLQRHGRALLIKLNNDLEQQPVGLGIKTIRRDAGLEATRDRVAAVEQTTCDDVL